ncbi:MAG TPA: kelch repeat-containing protein [Vicinamibacterales bacterium]|nr:kelch repeat-containing protein [Vicinamibacterales bacterium]
MRASLICVLLALTFQATSLPPARAHHSIVYDAATRRVLIFGGSTSLDGGKTYMTFDDAWAFDGKWRGLGSTGAERSGMAVAFDTKRRRVVAFGGYCPCQKTAGGRYADLLELRDGKWQKISEIPSRPSTDSRMVYDARRDRLVLFGGSGPNNQAHADTWEFDGATWRRFEGAGPEQRGDFAMTYDEGRGRTVVFGGIAASGPLGDTWEFDGAAWTRVATDGPAPRFSISAVYDAKRERVILYGGGDDETWAWNGTTWTKLADVGPPRRYLAALAYDVARDRVVLFGGRPGLPKPDANDTWEWNGTRWIQVSSSR